jgi:cytochrome c peroxidase
LSLLGLVFLASGCTDSSGPDTVTSPDRSSTYPAAGAPKLDLELQTLLWSGSDGKGLEFFMLPGSSRLGLIPQDPRNPLTPQKVHLGRLLYHETAMGVNNIRPEGEETYACASCHHAQGGFQANLPQGISEGGSGFGLNGEGRVHLPQYDCNPDKPDVQPIRTPTVLNTAYQELMLWNGQFGGVGDNLGTEDKWTAGTPLESNQLRMHGLETQVHAGMSVHRMLDIEESQAAEVGKYAGLFRAAFQGEPEPVNRLNCSLAIAAYERTVLADRAPFQRWLKGNRNAMSLEETRGAILFFGKAGCVDCHTGPALSSMTFYAQGMNDLDGAWDRGRVNLRPFGDTVPEGVRKGRGGFTGLAEDNYKFKTPQLYNLLDSPFYGHGASFSSVREVVEYMNLAIPENPIVPGSQLPLEFVPLGLSPEEVSDLTIFIETGLYDPDLMRYTPQRLPSGNCFPVNDPVGRADLGCSERNRGL